jgi:hypothetical protein
LIPEIIENLKGPLKISNRAIQETLRNLWNFALIALGLRLGFRNAK